MAFPTNKIFDQSTIPVNNVAGMFLTNPNVDYLKPRGSGLVDILNNHMWSNAGNVSEVPYIMATEYELQYGAWTQNIANAFTLAANIGNLKNTDPYLTLYAANQTGFSYAFPWLITSENSKIRSTSNNWTKAAGLTDLMQAGKSEENTKSGLGGALLAGALGLVSPGVGIEDTYQYADTSLQEITIKFPLYNTIDTQTAFDNYCFVTLFNFQNLKNRTSFITYIPPKIYSLDAWAYGGIYWPAAYVSTFSIDSIGTTRYLTDYAGYINGNALLVPEAYRVNITFKQLLADSANIFSGTMGGTKVQVANPLTLGGEFQNIQNGVVSSLKNSGNLIKAGITAVAPAGAIAAGIVPQPK